MPVNNNGSHSTSEETSVTLAAVAQLSEQPEPESEKLSLSIEDMPAEILQEIMKRVEPTKGQRFPVQLREVSRNFKTQYEAMLKRQYPLSNHHSQRLVKQQRVIEALEAWLADQTEKKSNHFVKAILPGCLEKIRFHNEGDKRDSTFHYGARAYYLSFLLRVYQQYQELLYLKLKDFLEQPNSLDPQLLEKLKEAVAHGLRTLNESSRWDDRTYYMQREQILNGINERLILDKIDFDATVFVAENTGLTRIPRSVFMRPNYQNFWRRVREVTIIDAAIQDLPPEMAICTNLRELTLHGNRFFQIPAVVCQLKTLEHLDFFRNKIHSLPPELEQLVNLKKLELSYNCLEQVPTVLTKLRSLETLLLDFNYLQTIPQEIPDEILQENGGIGDQIESSKASTLRLQKYAHLGWKVQNLKNTVLVDGSQFHQFFEDIIQSTPSEWSLLVNPLEEFSDFPVPKEEDDAFAPDERPNMEFSTKYSTPLHVVMSQLVAEGFLPLSVLQAIVTKENLNWNFSTTDEAPDLEKQQTPIALFMEAVSKGNPVALAVLDTVLAKPEIDWEPLLQIEKQRPFPGKAFLHILIDTLLQGSLPAYWVLESIANNTHLDWNAFKNLQNEPLLHVLVKAVFHREDISPEIKNRGLKILKKIAAREDLAWDVEFSSHEEEQVSTPRGLLLTASGQGSIEARNILEVISAKPIDEASTQEKLSQFFKSDAPALAQLDSSSSLLLAENATSHPLTFRSSSPSRQAKRPRDEGSSKGVLVLTGAEAVGEEESPSRKRAKYT